jgi:hypothetical protein
MKNHIRKVLILCLLCVGMFTRIQAGPPPVVVLTNCTACALTFTATYEQNCSPTPPLTQSWTVPAGCCMCPPYPAASACPIIKWVITDAYGQSYTLDASNGWRKDGPTYFCGGAEYGSLDAGPTTCNVHP